MKKYAIGIDVGGTKTAYGVYDLNRGIISSKRHMSNANLKAEDFFDIIVDNIKEILFDLQINLVDLYGIGIGVPSFVNFDEGYIIKTSNLKNIKEFPAREYLHSKLGEDIRIVIDNDCHASALSEHKHGAGRGFSHMLFCPVSTGIASGIIIDNKLFRGSYGWSGESGHAIITPNKGIECGCGNKGCLMSWCSGSMIIKHIQNWISDGEKSVMIDLAGSAEEITTLHLSQAAELGDPLAVRALDQMACFMSIWLYNLYVTLNINCFVFGGGLLGMGEKLFSQVRNNFDGYNQNDRPVYFKNSELCGDFGTLGALELLL